VLNELLTQDNFVFLHASASDRPFSILQLNDTAETLTEVQKMHRRSSFEANYPFHSYSHFLDEIGASPDSRRRLLFEWKKRMRRDRSYLPIEILTHENPFDSQPAKV
jgi:hypothetical protein